MVPPTTKLNCVTTKSPVGVSTSVSFVNTFPVAGVSSLVVLASATASGFSFGIGVTLMSSKPVSVNVPSVTV